MEQLTNMPLWAQLLSMGSFMFASGVLMTRIPLAPAIILSFFYLCGAFGNFAAMPSFTLKHPWVWAWIHIGLASALVVFWLLMASSLIRWVGGSDGIGIGLAGVYLMGATAIVCLVTFVICLFPAFVKWFALLRAVPGGSLQIAVWILLFVGGIAAGVFTIGGLKTLRAAIDGHLLAFLRFQLLGIALGAIIICMGSLASLAWGAKPLGILGGAVALILAVVIAGNAMCQWRTQHVHSRGQQVLLDAAEAGQTQQVQYLLSHGKSVNARDDAERTALFNASEAGHLDTVQVLLKAGADVNARTSWGSSPLIAASNYGYLPIVEELLKAGANVDFADEQGGTALAYALTRDHTETAIRLIQAGANVHSKSYYGRPLLYYAAGQKEGAELVKLLLEKGADVNEADVEGATPLQIALGWKDREEAAKILYAAGGRLGKISKTDQTGPMMDYACSNGFTEVVDQLLQAGVKPTPHNAIMAAQEGQTEVLKQLVAARLDINQPDDEGSYPFLSAVGLGHLDTVRFFVEQGADIALEEKEKVGPALVLASLSGHLPIVKYLVEQKADINIRNSFGETPLMMATAKDHNDIALFLLEQGAKVNLRKNVGTTALKFAAGNGNVELIQALLKAGADVNLGDKDNDTPLGDASFEGHKEAVQALLEAGAQVNAKNQEGKTALTFAREKGFTEIVELLKSAGAKE